jgi:hypothetical protein
MFRKFCGSIGGASIDATDGAMAKNQRRRKSGKRSRRREVASEQAGGGGGSLSAMRSGFRSVVRGGGGPRRPADRGTQFLRVLGVLLVLGLIVWAIAVR